MAALLAIAVAGCGARDLSDLERLVADAARSPAHGTPVPASHGAIDFKYGAMGERSPFEPFTDIQGTRTSTVPDRARIRQPQEFFPLGQLEMVGTLAGRGTVVALIRDPRGNTHSLAVGDYLGRDHGRITRVRDTRIDILELVEDDQGGWTVRARALELSVSDGSEEGPEVETEHDNGGIEE